MRPEREILEYEPDIAFLRGQIETQICAEDGIAVKENLTGIRRFQSCNHSQERSLAAPRGTQERSKCTAAEFNGERRNHCYALEGLRDAAKRNTHVLFPVFQPPYWRKDLKRKEFLTL